eukprot:6940326-Lingulodinium_polyedra.AAC.1
MAGPRSAAPGEVEEETTGAEPRQNAAVSQNAVLACSQGARNAAFAAFSHNAAFSQNAAGPYLTGARRGQQVGSAVGAGAFGRVSLA